MEQKLPFLLRLDEELRKINQKRPWLSKASGIPLSTINSWFSKNVLPRLDDAYKITEILKVTIDYLMTGKSKVILSNPVLNNIVNYLQNQDPDNLKNIEAALTMFNYQNATQINLEEPTFMLDSEFRVTWVNERFTEIFGSGSNYIGSPLSHVHNSVYQKSLADTTEHVEDGLIPVQNNLILIPIAKLSSDFSKPFGYAGLISNVSDDKALMDTDVILKLVELSLLKEFDSVNHIKRVRGYAKIILNELKDNPEYPGVDDQFIEDVIFFAPMHDIGNIGIPDDLLNKQGKLKKWEITIIREHTINGAYILSTYSNPMGKQIALQHQEKWDGSGYPYGLEGKMICLAARIASVIITYDTLRSRRNFRDRFTHKEALKTIVKGRGTCFEPGLVDVFMDNAEKMDNVYSENAD
ncbi:MAG: HD domain-containing protein [Spirochaetales bacterium]|nr:HD domain-containing protein [Spirochaetales bacterium]